ncbi:endotoxic shock protective protein U9-ORF-like isoform X4 [Peromyscus eremicus]|uniref:endotoxic shock protective protein U9-ORF-like isoform X4 n=1 Tax=Peromyscus eremicus TaxID=42410 RepID=UPI0027DBECCE|nr:endotoxic shock protective protein U9-ORF-like isoform X4 [Peromyscus eremicus]
MKVLMLMAFLVLAAHCVPVSRFPGKIILCYPFLHSKCLRLCESLKLCGKPRTNRTTPMAPSFSPTKKPNFSLTGSPPAPLTPDRRGDSR